MFAAWGHFAYQHRKIVPAAIVSIMLLGFLIFGTKLDERMSQEGWDDPHSSSTRAAQIEQETFGRDNSGDVILLFDAAPGANLDDPATLSKANDFLDTLKNEHPDQISHIDSFFEKRNQQLLSPDKRTAFAAIGLKGDGEDVLKNYRAIEADLSPKDGTLPEGITVKIAGSTAVADALDEGMAGDIKRAELYALPAVALLLLLVFGSLVAAGMPLIVGVLSILGSLGVLSILATQTQVNVFAQSVVTLLGLGLAIDYGLFMVSRFREELDEGVEVPQAVANTTATAGKTVVFSAAMVAVALSGLFIFPQAFLKSVAYGAISAVGLAAILSVTVLPSLFGLLGKNIDRLSIRRRKKLSAEQLDQSFWARVPAWAMRRSTLVTWVLVIVMVALTVPLMGVKFGGINETYLPPDNPVREAQAQFDTKFPNFRTEPVKLVVTSATNEELVQVFTQANNIDGLTGRFSPVHSSKDGTTVLAAGIANRDDNARIVQELREIDVPNGVEVYIGGTPALEVESIEALLAKLPWMFLYIILATFILMALVFGSLILPAKAIIMTILGLGSTLGILTAMFVDGVGAEALNFTAGPLMSPVLVLIMAIVYGLSTDYEVFLVSRMVEARQKGATTDEAIRYGTAHTGSIITAAAVIMIVVCGAFGFSEIVMMKYIAFGMIAALLLDATVIRMLLVPAVMHFLREDNWWAPPFVKKASSYLGHSSETGGRHAHPTTAEPASIGASATAIRRLDPGAPQTVEITPVRPGSMREAAQENPQEPAPSPKPEAASTQQPVHNTALIPTVSAVNSHNGTPVVPQYKFEKTLEKGLDVAAGAFSQGLKKLKKNRAEGAAAGMVEIPAETTAETTAPEANLSRIPGPDRSASAQSRVSQVPQARVEPEVRGVDTQQPTSSETPELSIDDIPLGDMHVLAADDAARGGRRATDDTKLIPFTELMERLNTNGPQDQ